MIKLYDLLNMLPIKSEVVILDNGKFIFKGTALKCFEHLEEWFDLEVSVIDTKEGKFILKSYE